MNTHRKGDASKVGNGGQGHLLLRASNSLIVNVPTFLFTQGMTAN
jgi:hypothetical protein